MHIYKVPFGDITLAAATAKTVATWINGATRRCRLLTIEIGGGSVTQTDTPLLLELVRFTTDGTGTGVTPVALDPNNPASIGTAKQNYTVEPTGSPIVVWNTRFSPIGNTMIEEVPMTREIYAAISSVLGLRVTSTPGGSLLRGTLTIEE